MREDGLLSKRTKLRFSKYLNNLIEQDHRGIKFRTRPMLGFKSYESAAITLAGIELLRRIHKDQFALSRLRLKSQAAPTIWNAVLAASVSGTSLRPCHLGAALAICTGAQISLIGLEACSGAHFMGRTLRKQGHDVRLIAAQFVKPFVKSNENDFVDAEAIAEAVERKNMRFVPIKTDDQLDLQAIHRVRDRLISRRTAVINQLRAFLLERGMVFAQTRSSRLPWLTSSRTRKQT